jgi:DNA polymerase/3'-5' exonuclease PolX
LSDKIKYPRAQAIAAAKEILALLIHERVIISGSLRRRKNEVGDIEILYIPKIEWKHDVEASDLFQDRARGKNLSDHSIVAMVQSGLIRPRENVIGRTTWGDKNKLAVHCASGIPVDFFATTAAAWFNYLVCRTGGSENNVRIASAAQEKGWKWHPYNCGFTDEEGRAVRVESEQDVFRLVGLPYLEPWQR